LPPRRRETAVQFEALALKTLLPEGVRSIAEKTVVQTREAYEKMLSKADWALLKDLSTRQDRAL
jgi:hypothetical protein